MAHLAEGCRPLQRPNAHVKNASFGWVMKAVWPSRGGMVPVQLQQGQARGQQEGEERGSGAGSQAAWRLTIKQV